MQSLLKTSTLALATALLLCVSALAGAADKKQQSYVKTNYRTAYKTAIPIGDVPNHEVAQEVSIADMKYSNPDFKVRDEWAYIQTDSVDGTGTQSGYFVDTHEDGSHTYGAFKGTVKTNSKPDGSWEVTWEGTYWYVGGSGKYRNIKGSGIYKGRMSSQEPGGFESGQETAEY